MEKPSQERERTQSDLERELAQTVFDKIVSTARNHELPNLVCIPPGKYLAFDDLCITYWIKGMRDSPEDRGLFGEATCLGDADIPDQPNGGYEFLFVEGIQFDETVSFADVEYLVEAPYDFVKNYASPPKKRDPSKEVPFSRPIIDKHPDF
jgi:hypothetical protein